MGLHCPSSGELARKPPKNHIFRQMRLLADENIRSIGNEFQALHRRLYSVARKHTVRQTTTTQVLRYTLSSIVTADLLPAAWPPSRHAASHLFRSWRVVESRASLTHYGKTFTRPQIRPCTHFNGHTAGLVQYTDCTSPEGDGYNSVPAMPFADRRCGGGVPSPTHQFVQISPDP